jgi:hypothetical protein
VFRIVDFSSVNDLKFTYVHLQFKNFSRGLYPRNPIIKGRGGKRRGKEGRDGDGMNPPKTNPVYGSDDDVYELTFPKKVSTTALMLDT